jgi:hypothetical protein
MPWKPRSIADAGLLVQDPIVLLYVAGLLAQRLDNANQALVELKGQVQAGRPSSEIGKTLDKIELWSLQVFYFFDTIAP